MVSEDKQYEFITNRIGDLSNATEDGLKLFIPMYSAILGGSIWLRFQIKEAVPPHYTYLSNGLVCLLTIVCIYIVADNLRAWRGYHKDLAKLTKTAPNPSEVPPLFPSAFIEIVLCAAMTGACVVYIIWNPFGT